MFKSTILQSLILFILFLLLTFAFGQTPVLDEAGNPTGLINMNPDPLGEPWIEGKVIITEEEIEEYNSLPELKLPAEIRNRQIPPTVDNSTEPQFRPIFNQIGGSCGQASSTGYHFTYERNLALGTLPDNKDNICAYGFMWNFVNGGTGSGSGPSKGYSIAEKMGAAHVSDFNGEDNGGSQTAWMNGYEGYYNANDCHVVKQIRFDPEDIDELRNWFYDKAKGTGEDGGCVTFVSNTKLEIVTIESGPFQGELLATDLEFGSAHCMTLAGYSDEIGHDVNGDGEITNDIDITGDGTVDYKDWERGAWQLVNSWGDRWQNDGKIWVLYSGFNAQYIRTIEVAPFTVKMMIKATVTHNNRGTLKLTTGFSSDISASKPSDTKGYSYAFNEAGGSHPMEGKDGSPTIEIGLDITNFYTPGMTEGKFFLIAESETGMVDNMSVMDYTSGTVKEIKCDQTNVPISGTTYLSVVFSGTPISNTLPKVSSSYDLTFHNSRIFFQVPDDSKNGSLQITLYNLQGRLLKTLVHGKTSGYSVAVPKLAKGLYFCTLDAEDFNKTISFYVTK